MAYIPSPDYGLMRRLFWAIATGIGIFVLVWDVTATQSAWIRLPVTAAIFAIGGTFFVEGVRWTYRAATAQQSEKHELEEHVPSSLFDAQLKEIQEIDNFVGRKSELDLRDTFDFPNMLKYNIVLAKNELAPLLSKAEDVAAMNKFFQGGQALTDVRFATLTVSNNAVRYERLPGKIGIINLSPKYVENRSALEKMASSSQLPQTIAGKLKEFDDIVQRNCIIMLEVLNDEVSKGINNIIDDSNYSSPYYGGASGAYWTKFVNLRPKAEEVSESIKSYLKVK